MKKKIKDSVLDLGNWKVTAFICRVEKTRGHVVLVFKDWELDFRPGKFAMSLDI